MGASGMYGSSLSDEERFAFLDEAYKRGEWFWDTGKNPMGNGFFTSKSKSQN
jgi:aryl-alcohol dehydrogenase-like predicted oxidoreductase